VLRIAPGEQVDDHRRPALNPLLRSGGRQDEPALEPVDGTGDLLALVPDQPREVGGAARPLVAEEGDHVPLERRKLAGLAACRTQCRQQP
jgi:hypothetical protein